MPALQVKDFPADVYDELRNCAINEDRSISQQTVHILRKYLALYKEAACTSSDPEQLVFGSMRSGSALSALSSDRFERRQRALERIAELPPVGIPEGYSSIAEMIREDRAARTSFVDAIIEDAR